MFFSAPLTRNPAISMPGEDDPGAYAPTYFADQELQELKKELQDVYKELGHARKVETSMAEELELRREALQELGHGNAVLRDSNENYRSKIASLEDAMSIIQQMHEQELRELKTRLWESEKKANNYEQTISILESEVCASRTQGELLLRDVEELIQDICSEHDTPQKSIVVDRPVLTSEEIASFNKEFDEPTMKETSEQGNLTDFESLKTADAEIFQHRSDDKAFFFNVVELAEHACQKPEVNHNSVAATHSIVKFEFEIPGSRDESYEELREQLDEAMVTMRDTEHIIREVASAAVAYREAVVANKRIKSILVATLTRAAMLSSQRTVDGKRIDPIVQALRRVLCT